MAGAFTEVGADQRFSAIIQRLDACQHLAMNALALQCGPQQWVLYAIIGLLEVYKSCLWQFDGKAQAQAQAQAGMSLILLGDFRAEDCPPNHIRGDPG